MTWRNPAAWLGLATLLLPVLVHLFSRRRARVEPFPSLRFLASSRLLPTPRTRLTDPWLLALRCLLLAVAVAALAQPARDDRAATRTVAATRLARAIVLDTGGAGVPAGIQADGVAGRDAMVRRLTDSATTHVLLRTARPAEALAGAVAWLETQDARREVAIVSAFRRGALDSARLAAVPEDVGVRLERLVPRDMPAGDGTVTWFARGDDERIEATARPDAEHTHVTWRRTTEAGADGGSGSDTLSRDAARTARAVRPMVDSVRLRPGAVVRADAGRAVRLVPRVDAALVDSAHVDSLRDAWAPWMAELVVRMARDPLLRDAASPDLDVDVPDARARGDTLLFVAPALGDGARAASPFAAARHATALLAAASEARNAVRGVTAEALPIEPVLIDDATLTAWSRTPAATVTPPTGERADPLTGPSLARWGWLLVILLLGVETLARRRGGPHAAG
jgi:hypothetical protein